MKRLLSILIVLSFIISAISCVPQKEVKSEETAKPLKLPPIVKPPVKQQDSRPRNEPVRISLEKEEKYIILNFDNTDIKTIITSFGELLGINYIVSPGVSGNITIQSYKKFPVSELFPVFQSILELNGLTAIKDGAFYKIIPIDSAKSFNLGIEDGKEVKMTMDPTFVTQLVPLEYVKASDVANVLRGFMPRGSDIVVYEPTNMLIITALPMTISRLMKIIETVDITDTDTEAPKTYVYDVAHGEAKKLAEILKSVIQDKPSAPSTAPVRALRPTTAPAATRTTRTTTGTAAAAPATTAAQVTSVSAEGITITAYEDINALIIKCTPKDYLALLEILKRLDVPPKQVLIEVLIAELTLSDSMSYGLEWLIKNGQGETMGYTQSNVEIPPIITSTHPGGAYAAVLSGIIDDAAFNSILSMVESQTKFNVIASPIILAMDNKESEITIGNTVPTASGLNQSQPSDTTSTTTLVSSGQIEYRDVGTILKVTPRITDKGNVSMEVYVESSSLGSSVAIGSADSTFPSFNKRQAKTFAVVGDNHTLFLGGIISDELNEQNTGFPYLSKIPYLGPLFFSVNSETKKKTELIVMITPHVVVNQQAADDLTDQYKNKIKVIQKSFIDIDKDAIKEKETEDAKKSAETATPSGEAATEAPASGTSSSGEAETVKPSPEKIETAPATAVKPAPVMQTPPAAQ